MSLPPDSDSPSEYESNLPIKLSRIDDTRLKFFLNKISLTHTLQALESIKRDFLRSNLQQNMQVRERVRAAMNKQAVEVGFKAIRGGEYWWS